MKWGNGMATALDVAAYILSKRGDMTAMKLQKLVYYSKAWHLVWENKSLFTDPIEAWANGPVVPELYRCHRGNMFVKPSMIPGNPDVLTEEELDSIAVVLEHYGNMKAFQLSDLTHNERPWLDARGSTPAGVPSNARISDEAMYEYYDGLVGTE